MKTIRFYTFLFLLAFHWVFFQTIQSQQREVIQESRRSKEFRTPALRNFAAVFPELTFGDNLCNNDVLLPYMEVAPGLKIGTMPAKELNGDRQVMYAVAKILEYKDIDMFVIEEFYEREDEDGYDNHVDDYVFLMFFSEETPVWERDGKYKKSVLSSSYSGEGGKDCLTSYFLPDTTIVSRYTFSFGESATGYTIPINGEQEYGWQIVGKGEAHLLDVSLIRLSSPFFDEKFMTGKKEEFLSYKSSFPHKEDKEPLVTYAGYHSDMELFSSDITIYFYCDIMDNRLRTVFETIDKNKTVVDTYIVGLDTDKDMLEKEIRGCPVIETSDGCIMVNPDGQFIKIKAIS